MQPSEPEEELKELAAREATRGPIVDPELERARARRGGQPALSADRPDADWLQSTVWWVLLGAIVVALAAWIVYVAVA
jgi:cytochrome c-type biogenesis protein CcmH/NrfG